MNFGLWSKAPSPSFNVDGPLDILIPQSERDSCTLALGPRQYLLSCSHNDHLSLQAITPFRLSTRHAMVMSAFCEPYPGIVAYNAVSKLLAEDKNTFDRISTSANELWKAAAHTCDAWEKYPAADEPNESSIYEIFAENPERGAKFRNLMSAFAKEARYEADFRDGTVVDVGGSHREVSFAIAKADLTLKFVVQDFESVIKLTTKAVPDDLRAAGTERRCIPFPLISHNWIGKHCVMILRNLIAALKAGAMMIVHDSVLPPTGSLGKWAMDLTITEIQSSREREIEDWGNLSRMADHRF
ncbi:S-adenosyl-L-methionine-dependent methyltransferase [Xylariaceae sp. FL0255]|nr:S-adenosyl-L-methionine-dependent methyltransferase [Xylariaceae sp. FL0255]